MRLSESGIIDLNFLENKDGATITINGGTYRILTNFLYLLFMILMFGFIRVVLLATYFMPESIYCVKRLISQNDNVNWPQKSCDLTPFDNFLWGSVKEKCNAYKAETIDLLKANIRDTIAQIQFHTLQKVHESWSDWMSYCKTSRSSHMNEIIFPF